MITVGIVSPGAMGSAVGRVLAAALAPALPNQFPQTAPSDLSGPTSSIATTATLKRGPASSIMYIFPYAIVAAALSRLAGPSALAPPLGGELERGP